MKSATFEAPPRYVFIDALRGIASMGVLLAHLVGTLASEKTLQTLVPIQIQALLFRGQFGVEVFFVLSGFVIALSLSQKPLTRQRALNFALRRQIRLDPPYFVALLMLMLLHAAFGRGFPDFKTLFLNLIYVHNVVGVPQVLGVAWTLCLEIQFYLIFLIVLALDQLISKPQNAPFSRFAVALTCVSGLISCLVVQIGTPEQLHALAPGSWFYFAAGVLSFWVWRGLAPQGALGILILGMAISSIWSFMRGSSPVQSSFQGIQIGILTALLLLTAGTRGHLETASLGRAVQFLGRISYSLYLTHSFTIEGLMGLMHALWGEKIGALSGLILAIPMAFLVAQLFYLWVELPSIKWAARFKPAGANDVS